jgi:hypothetical protein
VSGDQRYLDFWNYNMELVICYVQCNKYISAESNYFSLYFQKKRKFSSDLFLHLALT